MTSKEKLKKLVRNEYREMALSGSGDKQKWTKEKSKRAVLVTVILSAVVLLALKTNAQFMGDFSHESSFGDILPLFIFPVIIGIIAGWWMDPKEKEEATEVDYDGLPIVLGKSNTMSQQDKEKYLEISTKDNPKGLVICEDSSTGKLLGIPSVMRKFGERIYNANLMLFGCSGSGKTTLLRLLLMQAINLGLSIFSTDPVQELTADRRAQLEQKGYKNIWAMHFYVDDIGKSDGVDLLKFVRNAKSPITTARKIASMILDTAKVYDSNPFWPKSITQLLTCIIVYVARCEGFVPAAGFTSSERIAPDKDRTLLEVVRIIQLGADKIYSLLTQTTKGNPHDENLLKMAGLDLWRKGDHDKQITSSLFTSLGILQDEEVVKAFSKDVIDFEKAITEKTYLSASFSTLDEEFKPLLSLFIDFYINEIESIYRKRTSQGPVPLKNLIILEELKVAGKIASLPNALATVRKYGTAIVTCTQSLEQISAVFGESEMSDMLGNTSIIYTGGSNNSKTLEELSKLSSCQFVLDESEGTSVGSRGTMFSEQVRQVERPVISYSQLANMKDTEIYIKLCNCKATIEKSFNADEHPAAGVIFRDKATGERRDLVPSDLHPGWTPEELNLEVSFEDELSEFPAIRKKTKAKSTEEDFL